MNRNFILLVSSLLVAGAGTADAQFLNRLAERAHETAKDAVERNVEKKVEEGVDKAFDADTYKKKKDSESAQEPAQKQASKVQEESGWTCPSCGTSGNTGKFCNECGAKKPETTNGEWTCPSCGTKGNTGKFCNECGAKRPETTNGQNTPATKAVVGQYAKCDFVPGDEVFYEDLVDNEPLGEFPSMWDLYNGSAEVATINGKKAIFLTEESTSIGPLMTTSKYLPNEYTIEFDLLVGNGTDLTGNGEELLRCDYTIEFWPATVEWNFPVGTFNITPSEEVNRNGDCAWNMLKANYGDANNVHDPSNAQDYIGGRATINNTTPGDWMHVAFSFNKRAFKAYINGVRVANLPNVAQAGSWRLVRAGWSDHKGNYITNIKMCKGAKPLYDRLASDGKIITYAITFATGKADLKPESMVEIMRIAKLMKDDPSLRFEVQGHCDNSGSDKINDPLSQKRAEAIVNALVGQGIEANRLSAVGKGSHAPLADNSTEEGRAKNRRVEFIKK